MKPLRLLQVVFAPAAVLAVLLYACAYPLRCAWGSPSALAKVVLVADPQIEGDARVFRQGFAGAADLALNDAYFAHISASLARWMRPTHTAMLGDLVSSEHVSSTEFALRVRRLRASFGPLFRASQAINVSGNHDIGYGHLAGGGVLRRFEDAFGPSNAKFVVGEHLFVNVNSMLLEGADPQLQRATWRFLEECAQVAAAERMPVVLLTHIPLFKQAATRGCDPFVIRRRRDDGRIVEQTHITEETSSRLLAMLRPKIVFSGHDHNGCFHVHSGGVEEHTVRSVMGDFGGNAALFTIARNTSSRQGEFVYTVSSCSLGLRMRDILGVLVFAAVWALSIVLELVVRCCIRGCSRKQKQKKA